ncbi:MAG: DUF4167 domain-containing protein [Pseudomonadota bacterium]
MNMNNNNNNNKRRTNNNMSSGPRHNNNRPRRFTNNRSGGAEDSANTSRIRRNAIQSREKYQNMAREALSMGDRVLSENYLQHADHYFRVLLALPPEEVRQPYNQRSHYNNGVNEEGVTQEVSNSESGVENQSHSNEEEHHFDSNMPNASALPAFITQPLPQINVHENIAE